jgi:HlyD family secretion protein
MIAARRRRAIMLALVLPIAVAGGYGLWRHPSVWHAILGPPPASDRIVVSGNIEAHQSVLSFTEVQAPIVELPFDEGRTVQTGALLARVDDRPYRQQVEIDRANSEVAAAQVEIERNNLDAAQHNVASDELDLAEKQRDYTRAENVARTKAGSYQTRDLALTAAHQSNAALARDRALVKVAEGNIELAKRNVTVAQAKLALDEITLSYTILRAPFSGVLSVREAELGQLAGPGVAIFSLADLDHVWLRAYVNEPQVGQIRLGDVVTVTTDSYPDKNYRGRISFISPTAEFTPKTVETHAERVTLVYRIRIDIDNPTHELLPGMPADATIPLQTQGK